MSTRRSLLQILSTLVILSLLFSGFSLPSASAQTSDGLKREINSQTGKVSFLGPNGKQVLSASKALGTSIRPQNPAMALAKRFGPEFGLKNPERELQEIKNKHEENGHINAKYQQKYQDIPVMAGELIVNTNDNGDLYSMNGEVSQNLSLSTQPSISLEAAKKTALEAVAKWNEKTSADFNVSEPELWIYDESLLQPSNRPAELVWRMEVTPKEVGMPVRELVLVNAQRGSISLHFNQIDTAWSSEKKSTPAQETIPTPTPEPIQTQLPIETLEPVITEVPTELPVLNEATPTPDLSANEVTAQSGAIWYVATTGNDNNSCSTPELPCQTVNGALGKIAVGDSIRMAEGIYTGAGSQVVDITKSVSLSGGWSNSFSNQSGYSVIDGENTRRGISVVNSSQSVTIDRLIIRNGYADMGAGLKTTNSTITIRNTSIYNNHASQAGGGIYSWLTDLSIQNSTIGDNHSSKEGGGIYFSDFYNNFLPLTINSSTIAYNVADAEGGGIYFYSGSGVRTFHNTIVAYNTTDGNGPDCYGTINSASKNIILDTSECGLPNGSNNSVDPKMTSTINDSVPHFALFSDSPAVNTGDSNYCLPTDQRGVVRPQGSGCDIGAYERPLTTGTAAYLLILRGSGQRTVPGKPYPSKLVVQVVDQAGNTFERSGIQITFSAPASGPSLLFEGTSTVATNQFGVASSPNMIANQAVGAFSISASTTGLASVNFELVNIVWFVATSIEGGDDNNTCDAPGVPCATIQGVIAKAGDGDTIRVAAGLYQGNAAVVDVTKSSIILGGWNPDFSAQTGFSILDGTGEPTGTTLIMSRKSTEMERLILRNSSRGLFQLTPGGYCSNSIVVTARQISITGMSWIGVSNCATLSLINSTISNNRATAITNDGTLVIQNSTITGNTGGGGFSSSGISSGAGSVTIENSILTDNTLGGVAADCSGPITSTGHNIIGTTSGCTLTPQLSDMVGIDPQLGPLLPNGYFPLSSTSPAIDAAISCPSKDQRGISRPQGSACDIGAYEYAAPGNVAKFVVLSGNHQHTTPGSAFSQPFQVITVDNQDNLVPNVRVTFTAPADGVSGTFATAGTNTVTVVSDATGIATTPLFTANSQSGAYLIAASASGVETIDFNLLNSEWYVAITGNDSNSCFVSSSPCATIQGAINKSFDGDKIFVATGLYTGTGLSAVLIDKSLFLSGGWDTTFTTQNSTSIIDGQGVRQAVGIKSEISASLDHFTIQHGYNVYGGGIGNDGTLTITNTTIQQNTGGLHGTGGWGGGGIFNRGTLTLNNSTISNNLMLGGFYGSAIYNRGTAQLNNSTISGNMDGDGALYNEGGVLGVNNSTITRNQHYGIYNIDNGWGGTVIIKNTILAGNTTRGDCFGTVTSQGYNLVGVRPADCTFVASTGDKVGTSAAPINPRLTLLQDSGGPTFTHALIAGGPAINAGNPLTVGSGANACLGVDQRGISRPVSTRCDIGAYEGSVQPVPVYRVSTYTSNHTSTLPGSLVCTQNDPACSVGDFNASMAQEYAIGTYNFYASQFLRNSLNNAGMTIVSSVHYCDIDHRCAYDGAFWDGTQVVYGDDNDDVYPFPMADDIVAHELTHGVTQYESNLFYYYQSGAIGESLSDLWGEYYDQWNHSGNDTAEVKWIVGEDNLYSNDHRSMSDPPSFDQPDKMSSTIYYTSSMDNGGVHYNSGINNKAVYLMVDGGDFNGKTVTALGWQKTAAIYYEANTSLLGSGSDYSDLYYAVQQACLILTGQKGITAADCAEVKDALDAVEMNGQPVPNFNTDASYCDNGGAVVTSFSDDFESGLGNWTFSTGYPRWRWDSAYGAYAQSGFHFLYADDYPPAVADSSARLKQIVIPNNAYLRFAHAYEFENAGYNYDGGVLEYSVNNNPWIDAKPLIDTNGYTGMIAYHGGNPLEGREAFVKSSHGYIATRLNLSSLAGKTVSFRWRMALDQSGYAWGWWVDNIQIYTCSPAKANVDAYLAGGKQGNYIIPLNSSVRPSYTGMDKGPVKIQSTNGVPLVASERVAYSPDGGITWTSYSELMGMPANQLTTSYTFPWYNNADLNTQLRFGNVGTASTTVTVEVGGVVKGTYPLSPNQSTRVGYKDLNAGPVKVTSSGNVPIIASERVAYFDGSSWTSFSEIMGLPSTKLTTSYIFPWYNNVDLNSQLRFGNVGSTTTTVTVTVGGSVKGTYSVAPNASQRISYAGLNSGPVKVTSSSGVPIIASMRVAYTPDNGATWPEFSEMMGMPTSSLSTHYSFPVYNDADLNTQLRFGNVGTTATLVTVSVGGVVKGIYHLAPNASQRVSYMGLNGGPVVIQSSGGVPIIASMRVAYLDTSINKWTSFAEMMGLPKEQLTTSYLFPWYNNVDLNTQLRFGVP